MSQFLLRNSLNPGKVVSCTITFRSIINKNEEGEPVWLLELNTAEPHKDGGKIPPVFVHYTSHQNLDQAVKEATETISRQIDWEPIKEDIKPPHVVESSPEGTDVSIYSDLIIDIEDDIPAAGIDPSSISVTVNGIDVTDEIRIDGDPFNYRIVWSPKIRVLDYYN